MTAGAWRYNVLTSVIRLCKNDDRGLRLCFRPGACDLRLRVHFGTPAPTLPGDYPTEGVVLNRYKTCEALLCSRIVLEIV